MTIKYNQMGDFELRIPKLNLKENCPVYLNDNGFSLSATRKKWLRGDRK